MTCIVLSTSFLTISSINYGSMGLFSHLGTLYRGDYTGCIKNLNKSEIALNFAKRLELCIVFIQRRL